MKLRKIKIVALIPTKAGCALFLGDDKKVIHFFIDLHVGASINFTLTGEVRDRPLTHDLFSQTLDMLGAKMNKMIITDRVEDIFYARVYMEMKNEVSERKIVVLDSRPSDALALAVRQGAALYIEESVMDASEDRTDLLEQLRDQADDFDEE